MTSALGDLLKPVALFASLDSAALRMIGEAARITKVNGGASFFREGDPAESFFVVQTGSVKLTQLTPEGHQVVLRLIGPGDAFGGVAAFGGATYPVTAEAVTDVTALEWPGSVRASLEVLPVSTLAAATPALLTALVITTRPPQPTRLRIIGWTLVAVSVLTSVIVVATR